MVAGVRADDEGKEFTGEHPLRVLKARYQNDNLRGSANTSARGNLTIWLQNITSVVVDGIDIEVELYNGNKRKVDTLKRNVDKLDPGEKKVLTFRWDVVAEDEVKPRFFIEYNARGNQKERFEGDTPTWN
jgi:hypothetical protein